MVLAALFVAAAMAAWTYRSRFDEGMVRAAFVARTIGVAALILLFLDPGLTMRLGAPRPVVLLDNSVSMHAATGRAAEARALAASLGDTASFGELGPGEPGGTSEVADALRGAVAGGRPVVIVTDGEVNDTGMIPADLLAQASVRVLARPAADDVALRAVSAPLRIAAGDSLVIEVEAQATGASQDSARVEVRDGERVLMTGSLRFDGADRARARLATIVPPGVSGERWLEVRRVGPADAEPGDDTRLVRVTIMPTPGVVVIAATPDWDARFLFQAMRDVVETPVRGYVQLERGSWRRMDDLRVVPAAEVTAAARGADLLVVRGDTVPWRTTGRSRLLWPHATADGDWYLAAAGASPVSGAFAGIDADSLPPAVTAQPLDAAATSGWTGVSARLARRGADVPVIGGRDGAGGRVIVFAVDGLYRWAFRGGASDQAWRTLVAESAAWLLATPEASSGRARVMAPVTQRGRAVRFRWNAAGAAAPTAITLEGDSLRRADTLRFDGAGHAMLALPVGRYRYTLEGGGGGSFAVEPYADELVPSPVTLRERASDVAPPPARRSLRDFIWLFGIAIAAFGSEWMVRRKLSLT
jgi:hypothetical protein